MIKFFFMFGLFFAHFLNFGAKIFFQTNLALSYTTSLGFLAPCQNSEKSNNPLPKKYPHRRHNGGGTDPIS